MDPDPLYVLVYPCRCHRMCAVGWGCQQSVNAAACGPKEELLRLRGKDHHEDIFWTNVYPAEEIFTPQL